MGLFFYFRFRNVQNCSKIINSLSFYLLRYLSKWLHRQKVHLQVASWILISSKVVIFKINTHNAGHIEPEKKFYGHHYSGKVIIIFFKYFPILAAILDAILDCIPLCFTIIPDTLLISYVILQYPVI